MMPSAGRAFVIGVLGRTMPLGAEVATPAPLALRAVTSTRTRNPTSAARTPYDLPVAPGTSPHTIASRSQRCHWNAKDVGLPVHVPSFAVSDSPTCGSPVIVGRAVFVGVGPLPGAGWTRAVGFEAANVDPSAFVALTRKRIRNPLSAARR